MLPYLLKKLLHLFCVLLGISGLLFFLLSLSPGDPARLTLISSGIEPTGQNILQLREQLGFNQPLQQQYAKWLENLLRGDWGYSYRSGKPVLQELLVRFFPTLTLAFTSILFALCLSIPLGVIAATRQHMLFDQLSRLFSLVGSSLPNFWLGLLLIYFISVRIPVLPVAGSGDWRHLILPTITLGIGLAASYSRFLRGIILELLRQDYVLAARARGVKREKIWVNHLLRNATVPFLTMVAMNFGYLLGGSIIIEKIFAWPGLGKMAVDAIFARDYPLIRGYVMFWMACFVFINFIVDLVCCLINPRSFAERK